MARGSSDDVSAVDPKPGQQSCVEKPPQAQGGEDKPGPACVPTKEVLIVGRYAIVTFLGRGATGVVHEVREPGGDSATLACKTVDSALGPGGFKLPIPSDLNSQAPEDLLVLEVLNKGVEAAQHELSTWEEFDHPNVIQLYYSIMEGPYKIHYFMPVATGTLANYHLSISPHQAKVIIAQIMDGVMHMHQKGFTHRDLKPSNILLTRAGKDIKALVSDFGISERGPTHTSKSGTPDFRAPEVTTSPTHGNKVDSYAIGLIYWGMLLGETYYSDKAIKTIDWSFLRSKVKSKQVTKQAQDFLKKLLATTPEKRLSVEGARRHSLVREIVSSTATDPTISSEPAIAGPSSRKREREAPAESIEGRVLRSKRQKGSPMALKTKEDTPRMTRALARKAARDMKEK
ncbi:Serine/threonine-protein kinase H2 [Tulasnella sp. JGI-2019a]|nr:Serine/threonine-protein kinase H2 [Tulasnella sp. JGI-2019a]